MSAITIDPSLPTFTYFKGRGFGQFTRVALSYLGVKYNNFTIDEITDEIRKKLPYGQVPLFEFEGFVLPQSQSIARYVAEKYNFNGKTIEEKALVDSIITTIHSDLFTLLNSPTQDKEKNEQKFNTIFGSFDKKLKESKYLVGDNYTIADIYAYVTYDYIQFRGFSELVNATKYPHLEELKKYFEANAGVAEYIRNRPDTKF